jgi:hypothetical protein
MPPQSGVLQQYRPAATAEPTISRVNQASIEFRRAPPWFPMR